MIFISGPAIARLCLRTRKWAHDQLRREAFGPVIQHRGSIFAQLPAVERYVGTRFSEAQLAAAAAGYPARILKIEPLED
jgi:hypothetical protein